MLKTVGLHCVILTDHLVTAHAPIAVSQSSTPVIGSGMVAINVSVFRKLSYRHYKINISFVFFEYSAQVK